MSEIPQNSGSSVERNPDGTFKEGHTKLGGAVKGARHLTTKVKEALEKIAEGKEFTYEEAFVKAILHKAITEKDPTIMKLIWNYLDGMPLQPTDLSVAFKPTPIDDVHKDESIQENKGDEETN